MESRCWYFYSHSDRFGSGFFYLSFDGAPTNSSRINSIQVFKELHVQKKLSLDHTFRPTCKFVILAIFYHTKPTLNFSKHPLLELLPLIFTMSDYLSIYNNKCPYLQNYFSVCNFITPS